MIHLLKGFSRTRRKWLLREGSCVDHDLQALKGRMEVRSPDTTTMTEASWDWRPENLRAGQCDNGSGIVIDRLGVLGFWTVHV